MYQNWYTCDVANVPDFKVVFYRSLSGNEPVRGWLQTLDQADKKTIGEDIKTIQFGWPIGMPVSRKLAKNLYEVRSRLHNRLARIIFTVQGNTIILLHGFIKKSQKTPKQDIDLALKRQINLKDYK